MDLNKAMIIGRLTRDPESRTTPSGQTVTNFSVATSLQWTDQSGQKQEKVEYHDIVTWRKLAEICAQYLQKGRQVYIEGRLQTRDWEGQDGVKRYRTEIIADNMIMLGSAPQQQAGSNQAAQMASPAPSQDEPTSGSPVEPMTVKTQEAPASSAAPATPQKAESKDEEEISIEDIPF